MTRTALSKQEMRKQVISLAKRRQRPGSGSSIEFLSQRSAMIKYPDLSPILKPIYWAVIGAVATRLYMPERLTQDLDIVIRQEDAGEVRQKLARAGFKYKGTLFIGGSSWLSPEGRLVDVVESSEAWLGQALIEAQKNTDAQGLPILPFPYLVMLKFQAGRLQDLADVSRMLGQANEKMLNAVHQIFKRFLPDEIEDLESLITLGKLEMSKEGDV